MRRILLLIFGLLSIAVVAVGVKMNILNRTTKLDSEVLRVAFPYTKAAKFYEPTKIHLAPEYIFLENTFSPLIELSATNGDISPGIAESYKWDGTDLRLKIRKGLKTVDGYEISSKDVEFSLKRLLVLSGNTHGNFKDMICRSVTIQKISDACPGIEVDGDTIVLKAGPSRDFLLPMLAAIDFAILPIPSVAPDTLEIKDYRNTSGPYYVETDSESGNITLRANKNHYNYSEDMPQSLVLVPTSKEDPTASLRDFREGRVDFITTIDLARSEDVFALHRSLSNSVLHTTMNIRSYVLTFTERGIKELSPEERFAIGRDLKKSFTESFSGVPGFESSSQFFPQFGEGGLEKDRLAKIEEKFKTAPSSMTRALDLTIVRIGTVEKFAPIVHKYLPNVQVTEGKNAPAFIKYESASDMPHMFIAGPDTGFLEDIGLISYSMNSGYMGLDPKERETWLAKYMDTPEKDQRLGLLRDLHYRSLSTPILVPLLVSPYVALARAPWTIKLSQLYANNPLWLIRKN